VQTYSGLAEVAVNYRRSIVAAIVAGGAALLGLSLSGHYAAGGAAKVAAGERAYRTRRFVGNALFRLAVISAIAILLLVAVRSGGWGVLVGLALFQLLLIAMATRPLVREIRRT
jgi:hypothetical protein